MNFSAAASYCHVVQDPGAIIYVILDEKTSEVQSVIKKENFYTAIGQEIAGKITESVPNEQKTINHQLSLLSDWVSPKNIPGGSLTQSLMMYFLLTGNSHETFEFSFFHGEQIFDLLNFKLENIDIKLESKFFDVLSKRIRNQGDPLNQNEELQLFVSAFKLSNKPSKEVLFKFKSAIRDLQIEIANR